MTHLASTADLHADAPSDQRSDPRSDMRARLVEAALAVLRRDGAAGLTVRAITTEAGCSTGTPLSRLNCCAAGLFLSTALAEGESGGPKNRSTGRRAAAAGGAPRWPAEEVERGTLLVMFGLKNDEMTSGGGRFPSGSERELTFETGPS